MYINMITPFWDCLTCCFRFLIFTEGQFYLDGAIVSLRHNTTIGR
jgi:hypothetical protein